MIKQRNKCTQNNRETPARAGALVAATALLGASLLTGCSDPPPPPPPPPAVVKAPPPPPPPVTKIADLMARLNIDARVNLPEDRAPATDAERIAVLTAFDAFARGDSSRLKSMLAAPDQAELDKLVATGGWKSSTEKISRVDLRCGKAPTNDACVLAVFHVDGNFEPQLWAYKVTPTTAEFEAVATPPNVMNVLSGEDWITAWYSLWQKDLEVAQRPDEEVTIPKKDLTEKEGDAGEESSAPSIAPAGAPQGPGSPGKRMPGAPIRAPKPGFN